MALLLWSNGNGLAQPGNFLRVQKATYPDAGVDLSAKLFEVSSASDR